VRTVMQRSSGVWCLRTWYAHTALDRGALVARLRMLTQLLFAYEIALNDGATELLHRVTFDE
jgi:hypothetical protein